MTEHVPPQRFAGDLDGWLASLKEPLCCVVGDDRVARIWLEAGGPAKVEI